MEVMEMKFWKQWLILFVFVGALVFGPAACNTIQGIGRDIERAGEAIEDAASN